MEMRSETLEGSLIELFLKLRMSHRDDEFCPFLQRPAIQVDRTIFRDEPMDVIACGYGT